VVVEGSQHGSIYVFDRRTGETLQILKHAQDGMVQTITVGSVFSNPASGNNILSNRHKRGMVLA
jgi:glucose dehydrogenase